MDGGDDKTNLPQAQGDLDMPLFSRVWFSVELLLGYVLCPRNSLTKLQIKFVCYLLKLHIIGKSCPQSKYKHTFVEIIMCARSGLGNRDNSLV